jgi:hypothetical protein
MHCPGFSRIVEKLGRCGITGIEGLKGFRSDVHPIAMVDYSRSRISWRKVNNVSFTLWLTKWVKIDETTLISIIFSSYKF